MCLKLREWICSFVTQPVLPLVLLLMLIGVSGSLTTCRYMMLDMPSKFHAYVPDIVNTILVILGLVSAIVLMIWYCKTQPDCLSHFKSLIDPHFRSTDRHGVLHSIERYAAFEFFLGGFMFAVLQLRAEGDCFSDWFGCGKRRIATFHHVRFFYYLFQLFFMCGEIVFCLVFHLGDVRPSMGMLIGFCAMQSGNFAIWFDSVLEEWSGSSHADNSTNVELAECLGFFDITMANSSLVMCSTRTTEKYHQLEKYGIRYFALRSEFIFVAAKLVLDCLIQKTGHESSSDSTQHVPDGNDQPAAVAPTSQNGGSSGEDERVGNAQQDSRLPLNPNNDNRVDAGEREPLLQKQCPNAGANHSVSLSEQRPNATVRAIADQVREQIVTEIRRRVLCKLFRRLGKSIVIGLILSSVAVMYSYLGGGAYDSESNVHISIHTFVKYRIAYWAVLTVSILAAYCIGGRRTDDGAHSTENAITRFDYFVIICSIGPFAQIVFSLVANVETSDEVSPTGLYLADELFHLTMVLCQTAFIWYAAQMGSRISQKAGFGPIVYEAILWFLAIANFSIWIQNSFLESHSKLHVFQKTYYDHWYIVFNIVNPIVLCYHMNCALIFASIMYSAMKFGIYAQAEREIREYVEARIVICN